MKRFQDQKLVYKFFFAMMLMLLPVVIANFTYFSSLFKKQLYTEKELATKHVVESVIGICKNLNQEVENGVLELETAQQKALSFLETIRYGSDDYVWVNDLKPNMIMHPFKTKLNGTYIGDVADPHGKKLFRAMVDVCQQKGSGYVSYMWAKPGLNDPVPKVSFVKLFEPWGWIIGTGIYVDDVEAQLADFQKSSLFVIFVMFVFSTTISIFVARKMTTPIMKLNEAANRVIAGENDFTIDLGGKDELGLLGDKFNQMIRRIQQSLNEAKQRGEEAKLAAMDAQNIQKEIEDKQLRLNKAVEVLLKNMEKFAHGDLTAKITHKEEGELGRLMLGFNDVVAKITDLTSAAQETASHVNTSSKDIMVRTEQIAGGIHEQASQIAEVASAVEQIAMTITENTNNAVSSAKDANTVGENARQGGRVIEDTIESMNRIADIVLQSVKTVKTLGKSSHQIGDIIEVINEIADQINLLALNAAIEAARAGEHGRGFAVVADEVRKLAEKTAEATKEIIETVKRIQVDTTETVNIIQKGNAEVESGKELASKAGDALQKIITSTTSVASNIQQVAEAGEEQTRAITEITRNVDGIRMVTESSASDIQNIADLSDSMHHMTSRLNQILGQFKLGKNTQYAGMHNHYSDEEMDVTVVDDFDIG